MVPSINDPFLLYYDNIGTIAQAKEPKSHHKIKHVLCHYHLIREIMEWGDINLQNIDGKENLTGPLTKALFVKEFDYHKSKMGIRHCTNWL